MFLCLACFFFFSFVFSETSTYSISEDNEDRIKLFDPGGDYNLTKNSTKELSGQRYITVRGQFNSTDVNIITLGFEKMTSQESSFTQICVISFSHGCHMGDCKCTKAQTANIYDLMINISINTFDSDTLIRAFMLPFEQKKIYSRIVKFNAINKADDDPHVEQSIKFGTLENPDDKMFHIFKKILFLTAACVLFMCVGIPGLFSLSKRYKWKKVTYFAKDWILINAKHVLLKSTDNHNMKSEDEECNISGNETLIFKAENSIKCILIGKPGNGKSSSGNTILRENFFKSSPDTHCARNGVIFYSSRYKETTLTVVDGPSITDTFINEKDTLSKVINSLNSVLQQLELFHAFLLVVRFGSRFLEEDVQTIKILKLIFGNDFIRKCCILLVTCGDLFHSHNTESFSFDTWCESQVGNFKTIYEECCKRAILFDNKTRDEQLLTYQLELLIKMVQDLKNSGVTYTLKDFSEVQNGLCDQTTHSFNDKNIRINFPKMLQDCIDVISLTGNSAFDNSSEENNDVKLLVFGKPGHGKSATANTILGRNVFKTSQDTQFVSSKVNIDTAVYYERKITVADGLCVYCLNVDAAYTKTSAVENDEAEKVKQLTENTLKDIENILVLYDAFLFVFRLGSRFLEYSIINLLRSYLGNDFFSKHCIIVITFGDHFDPTESESFDSWRSNQEGFFKDLMNECGGRVLLFDNKTQDAAKLKDQKNKLLSMVDSVISLNKKKHLKQSSLSQR